MYLSEASFSQIKDLKDKVTEGVKGARAFEQAAQIYTESIYSAFRESVVLARVFASIRYHNLPAEITRFVDVLASSKGISKLISKDTLVLTLMGSSGARPAWNDRKKSDGHIGIPLASADFIEAIPMMSRLLKELGVGLDWIDSGDTDIVKKTIGSMTGMFYVPDARTAKDKKGRDIIAARDFVSSNDVQSVFGFGGGYLLTDVFCITIIFLREELSRQSAEQFAGMMAFFKTITNDLIKDKKLFV
jgi:hypothetical protein